MHGIPVLRVAAIHDLSGFGRASLTVAIPILSTMGIQVCPLPTAVLSSQTSGVDGFTFHDLTEHMGPTLDHWSRLGLRFDAVYSGFLGSPAQVDLVERCIRELMAPGGFAVVDPVLGDNGKLDATQTPAMVASMKRLAAKADILTPNLTEAAFLLDEPWQPQLSQEALKQQLLRLAGLGPKWVVITSAPPKEASLTFAAPHATAQTGSPAPHFMATVAYDREQNRFWRTETPFIPAFYPGTGDMFASVLTGALLQGDSLPVAMDRATQFVLLGIRATYGYATPHRDGVLLERVLQTLRSPWASGSGGMYSEF